jgi:hypothetical protein
MKAIIKETISIIKNAIDSSYHQDCTFWACDSKPENNRIVSMKTCSRCQNIILLNRQLKKLERQLNKIKP